MDWPLFNNVVVNSNFNQFYADGDSLLIDFVSER